MRTPRQKDRFGAFSDHQTLLVPEIILYKAIFRLPLQPQVRGRDRMLIANAGEDRQFVIDAVDAGLLRALLFADDHHLRKLLDFFRESDVVGLSGFVHRIVFAKGRFRDINLCIRVDLRKGQNTAAVVIVTMAEYNCIHFRKVDPKLFSIFNKQIRLSGIHEQLMLLRLNIKAQAVLNAAAC